MSHENFNYDNAQEKPEKKRGIGAKLGIIGTSLAVAGASVFGAAKFIEHNNEGETDSDSTASGEQNPGQETLETVTTTEQILLTAEDVDKLIDENAIPSDLDDQEFIETYYDTWTKAINSGKEVGNEKILNGMGIETTKSLATYEDNDSSGYTTEEWASIMVNDQKQWYGDVLWGPEDERAAAVTDTIAYATDTIHTSVIDLAGQSDFKYERTLDIDHVISVEENSDGGRTYVVESTTHDNFMELFPDHPEGNKIDGHTSRETITTGISEDGATEYVTAFKSTAVNF